LVGSILGRFFIKMEKLTLPLARWDNYFKFT
jgi:hypothetical protein